MDCYYCDKIEAADPEYAALPASRDLGSAAPRCTKHWRYGCGMCGAKGHFMSMAYCRDAGKFFCSECAAGREEVAGQFWAWKYFFSYRSPWSGEWIPSLDRMEHEGLHPLQSDDSLAVAQAAVSDEEYLVRYPDRPRQWHVDRELTDVDVQANWNANAERFDSYYDEDGDSNRGYQSDESMLRLLGEVRGQRILDVGSGNGYLCRKLARAGAAMTGVELSDGLLRIASDREKGQTLGIDYHHASASEMGFLQDSSFDKAVANYVLMDIGDYTATLGHVFRVLRPGGCFVAVISHPCFDNVPGDWAVPAPDSPRREDRYAFRVDAYFHRGPTLARERDLDPVLSFHRPLRDYWRAFCEAGFVVDDFEERSITDRGRRELPEWRVEGALRRPYSCMFRLVKPL